MTVNRRFTDWDKPGAVTVSNPVQCSICKRRTSGDGYPSCSAFERIPVDILANWHNHRKSYPGDGGIHFERKRPRSLA